MVQADTQSGSARGSCNLRTGRVSADLVGIPVDLKGRMPADTLVRRTGNAANMNIRQNGRSVASHSHGTHAKRWPKQAAVDQRGPRIPALAPRDLCEARQRLQGPLGTETQDLRIVGADQYRSVGLDHTGEYGFTGREDVPVTVRRSLAELVAADNGENSTLADKEVTHGRARQLVRYLIPGNDEDTVIPVRRKNSWNGTHTQFSSAASS